ncbi:hypothetical protein VNO77_16870 [Canavalia gladiata]|uniref:F-box domain-containing protein n=1 Tax=Canavalia gladiata TaxID=3824 RepID=A0AAN9QM51_CANGL
MIGCHYFSLFPIKPKLGAQSGRAVQAFSDQTSPFSCTPAFLVRDGSHSRGNNGFGVKGNYGSCNAETNYTTAGVLRSGERKSKGVAGEVVGFPKMAYSSLPDELWRRILELGIESSGLSYKDLCCVSISCRRFRRLSSENSLWNRLIASDFPKPLSLPSSQFSKSLYKLRFEKDKKWRMVLHRRAHLRKQGQISVHSRRIRDIHTRYARETVRAREIAQELSNLRRVRRASVALNVWQPEVIRGSQNQMVEQCAVPVESRIHSLEMELQLCKKQTVGLEKYYKDEKHRLDAAKEELASMMYHPVREHKPVSGGENEHDIKQKELKTIAVLSQVYALTNGIHATDHTHWKRLWLIFSQWKKLNRMMGKTSGEKKFAGLPSIG